MGAAVTERDMRKTLLLAILYAVFAAGALATCLFGRAGVAGYRALKDYAAALEANIEVLERAHAALSERLDVLQTDPATVRLLARPLGYREEGERPVVLESYQPAVESPQVGHVLSAPVSATRPRRETLYLIPLVLLFLVHGVSEARRRDG